MLLIRKATPSDYPAMESVFRQSTQTLCSNSYDEQTIAAWTGQYWPERFAKSTDEGVQHYVLLIENKVICFGSVHFGNGLLASLFLSPEYAGQGLGKVMLNFLFEQAKERDLTQLKLDSSLNAVNFYAKHGFKELKREKFKTQSGLYLESIQMIADI